MYYKMYRVSVRVIIGTGFKLIFDNLFVKK